MHTLKRVGFGLMVTLLWLNMLTFAFCFQMSETEGTRPGDIDTKYVLARTYAPKISLTYRFPEPKIEEGYASTHAPLSNKGQGTRSYVSVTMDDLLQYDAPGLPVLPFKAAKILLPFGTRFEHVRAIGGKKTQFSGSYLVECGQEPVPLTSALSTDVPATNSPNETVYGSSEPFPGILCSDVSVQSKMGYKILLANLHPVEYIPETGKLFYYESIRLEVEVTPENEGENPAFHGYPQHREILKGMVDNPEMIETYPASGQTPTYQYVIITNRELNNTPGPYNFQALRDDKISRGIPATIVTVEWIYANYDGTRPDGRQDNQTRIRNFIVDAYSNWGTMYVLLGGDGDGGDVGGESGDVIIPHRGFASVRGKVDYDIPADMYYGCLDGTFDYDCDGIYGEPKDGPGGGEVDLFAEVYVGRACVDSQREVQNFVRKTLAYQRTSDGVNLRKVWMVGEYLGFGGVAKWGGNYKDEIKKGSNAHGYTTVGFENSLYADKFDVSTLYDRDYPGNNWPKSEVIDVINDNVHLINHMGHADVGYVMKMTNTDVDTLLTNDELYFIGYSQGCYSGSFDNRATTVGSYTSYDCISEHLTTEEHGAVAFISNSRYGWGVRGSTNGPSQHYDREFWDALLGEDIFNIGIANQDSKEDNAGRVGSWVERWCYYEINLFGDPELRITLPQAHELNVDVEAPAYLEPGDSSLLNATVYNRGFDNATDVKLFLLINGTEANHVTIPELTHDASYTINYLWAPTEEGSYNITAYAPWTPDENVTENNFVSRMVLVLDSIPPTVSILSPLHDDIIASTDVTLSWIGADRGTGIKYYLVYVNRDLIINTTDTLCELRGLAEGFPPQNVTVTAYDEAGNFASDQVCFTVDATAPDVEILSPENGCVTKETSIIVVWDGSDNETEIASYLVFLNDTQFLSTANTSHELTDLGDGVYTVKIEAYDLAGNWNSDETTVTVDVTAPRASIDIPPDASCLKGMVVINITSDDVDVNLMELHISNELIETWNTSGTKAYVWNTTSHADGSYTIKLVVHDKVGNYASTSVSVIVDNTEPIIEIRNPIDGTYLKDICNITVYGYDINMDRMELRIDESILETLTVCGTQVLTWNTTALPDGLYTLSLTAHDEAGNSIETAITVTVDNSLPSASVTSPTNGDCVRGVCLINLAGHDANLDRVELYIGGRLVDTWTTNGAQTYNWNTTAYSDDCYSVELKVYDKAGNMATANIMVTIDNAMLEPETDSSAMGSSSYSKIPAYLIFFVYIGAVIAYIFTKLAREKIHDLSE